MRLLALLLFAYTLAMIAYHLVTMRVVQRALQRPSAWLRVANLVRFEALYYVLLVAFMLWTRAAQFIVALVVLGSIHLGFWIAAELRPAWLHPAGPHARRNLIAVQIFDWGEALVLTWIAWTLVRWPT